MGGRVALSIAGKFVCGSALMGFLLVWSLGVVGISWVWAFAGLRVVALVLVLRSLSGGLFCGA
jgi:hypothetical protein